MHTCESRLALGVAGFDATSATMGLKGVLFLAHSSI